MPLSHTPRPMPSPSPSSPPCACGRLRRATRALTQLYDDAMAPAELRVTQFSLLSTLARSGPMRISELAAAQLLDRTALSRNLDPLVELTRPGRAALRGAMPCWERAQKQVAKRLGTSKLEALIAMLSEVEALHPDAVER